MPSASDQLPAWAAALLTEARVGHLGLIDSHGRPRVLPVTFALCGEAAWSAIDHKPKRAAPAALARVRWLRERPLATLCVDHYSDRWEELAWVQLVGATELVEAGSAPDAVDALARRYPQYRAQPPAGPLIRLRPQHVAHWRAREA